MTNKRYPNPGDVLILVNSEDHRYILGFHIVKRRDSTLVETQWINIRNSKYNDPKSYSYYTEHEWQEAKPNPLLCSLYGIE